LRLRSFFKSVGEGEWPIEKLAEAFGLEAETAVVVARELARNGLVEDSTRTSRSSTYRVTLAGRRLALASAARPLTKQTAGQALERFLDRVRAVNADAYYLYRVQQVLVFGSYLSRQDRVTAIDVVVKLAPRYLNPERQTHQMEMRAREARQAGRN